MSGRLLVYCLQATHNHEFIGKSRNTVQVNDISSTHHQEHTKRSALVLGRENIGVLPSSTSQPLGHRLKQQQGEA